MPVPGRRSPHDAAVAAAAAARDSAFAWNLVRNKRQALVVLHETWTGMMRGNAKGRTGGAIRSLMGGWIGGVLEGGSTGQGQGRREETWDSAAVHKAGKGRCDVPGAPRPRERLRLHEEAEGGGAGATLVGGPWRCHRRCLINAAPPGGLQAAGRCSSDQFRHARE